jgi:hypothetical protein
MWTRSTILFVLFQVSCPQSTSTKGALSRGDILLVSWLKNIIEELTNEETWNLHSYLEECLHPWGFTHGKPLKCAPLILPSSVIFWRWLFLGEFPHEEASTLGIHPHIWEINLPHLTWKLYYFIDVVISWREHCR